jgi:hypothetical protein
MTTSTSSSTIREHDLGADGVFSLRLRSGAVRLHGVDGTRATVRSTDGRSLDHLAITATDRSLSVAVETGFDLRRSPNVSPSLDIDLPAGCSVVVEVASADIEAIGLTGDQRYRTTSGDLHVTGGRGTIAIEGVSADLDLVVDGPASVRARTVSGDLSLRAGVLTELRAMTTSGDVRVAGDLQGDGPFALESVSGDVLFAPAGGLRIEYDSITGDIRSAPPSRRDDRPGRRALIIRDGGPTLSFRSTSGDLVIVDATPMPASEETVPAPPAPPEPPVAPSPAAPPAGPDAPASSQSDDDALTILQALERGDLDVAEAERRLADLDRSDA